ncbi:MAG: STAS domain-containing protein [Pseudomonadota bacterium]|jgi:phospholipid transport system transporter-binding protein|uniref:STAS domain protein n=1 Tax=Methylophaga aminisulfidivorans MP TaxID=1026882 RepID=F5T1C9_9GAMM|nr:MULTISPECIES: STAS domain-containing protein [Methylophaga]EGL53734.1 STAS domain protein [Methylophaga aminisulfidivorans MP]MEC9413127.1 STAS domain-containing protein [Pseudomonadota bacterium]WVI85123.1 STAS domain-containing protein [Methylophaga thalassica]
MSELFAIKYEEHSKRFVVTGEMTLESAKIALTESKGVFDAVNDIEIDLQHVTQADSAGLALLVDWMRAAKKAKKSIAFKHLPEQMDAIAKASGLDELLPLK